MTPAVTCDFMLFTQELKGTLIVLEEIVGGLFWHQPCFSLFIRKAGTKRLDFRNHCRPQKNESRCRRRMDVWGLALRRRNMICRFPQYSCLLMLPGILKESGKTKHVSLRFVRSSEFWVELLQVTWAKVCAGCAS